MKNYKVNIPKLMIYLEENKIQHEKLKETIVIELHENVSLFFNVVDRKYNGETFDWCEGKTASLNFITDELEDEEEVTIRIDFIVNLAMNGIFIEEGC